MQKLIALLLSISLVFGSVTPSLAQSNKIIKGAGKALTKGSAEAAQQALPNAAKNAAGAGIKYLPKVRTQFAKPPYKQVIVPPAGRVPNAAAPVPAVNPAVSSATVFDDEATKRLAAQINSQIPVLNIKEIRELAANANLTEQDAKKIYHQIFNVKRSDSAKEFLLLNVLPSVTVERGFPIGAKQAAEALEFYRRTLAAEQANLANMPSFSSLEELLSPSSKNQEMLNSWAKAMAAAANLGFFAPAEENKLSSLSSSDAARILSMYDSVPKALKPITHVVLAHSLLAMNAKLSLANLGDMAAQQPAKLFENEQTAEKVGRLLSAWNKLNIIHVDPSPEATLKWLDLNQNKGKIIEDPLASSAKNESKKVAPMAAAPILPADLSLDFADLQVEDLFIGESPVVGSSSYNEAAVAAFERQQQSAISAHIARVNSRYANVSYTKQVSQGLQYGLEKAERKYIQEYGKAPTLDNPVFQQMWVDSAKPELEKLAANNKRLNEKAQQDVLATLEASFDPAFEIKAIETPSFFTRAAQFFRSRADRRAAAKANRAAQEASIKGMEVSYPASLESAPGAFFPQDYEVKFVFDSESTKKAFLNVGKLDSETFVIDSNGSLLLRSPSGSVRGLMGVQIEGGNAATQQVFRVLSARNLAPRFANTMAKADENEAMELLSEVRVPLRTILSKEMKAENPELSQFLVAKDLASAKTAFMNSGKVSESLSAVAKELNAIIANNADKKDIVFNLFTDKAGDWALKLTAFSEGLSSFGQAISAATKIFGNISAFEANLPSSAGQFGPFWAPFISGLQTKLGLKHTAYWGQALSAAGLGVSAASLAFGAAGVLDPMLAFDGMVGGILLNGIAGNGIIKQTNSPIAKAVANDPVSASSTVADLNSWASAGGMYCYLFLPVVGAATSLLFGIDTGLATLAAMFGVAGAAPLASAGLMRMSKIKNIKEKPVIKAGQKGGFWRGIWQNLKFAFTGTKKQELEQLVNKKAAKKGVSPTEIKPTIGMKTKAFFKQYLVQMAGRVGLYHFGGMVFNSGPGTVLKDVFAKPEQAMLASFFAVYLTVFLGRKLGAKAMGQGLITDKALIGLSSLIAVGAGGLSILPGLDIYTRSALWAIAGLGFANLANQEQAMALNRPENAGQKAAVSMIYVLARLTGMGTILYGMFSDQLALLPGLTATEGAIYGLSLPLVATALATAWNKKLITKDLKDQVKIWTTKKPKVLSYTELRQEVESAITNNPNLGVAKDDASLQKVVEDLGNGLMSRYRIDLTSLEQTMMGVSDKTALDLYRLDMMYKLYDRLPENPRLATGNPLTYETFRAEIEPLYNSIVKARALGKPEEEINKLITSALDGIMAKYPVGRADLRVIEARLLKKTRIDRIRMATMKYLYGKQLTKAAENEINVQVKKMVVGTDKADVIKHVVEKYQAMANAKGIEFVPPANAAL